jgi:hypothetical protein
MSDDPLVASLAVEVDALIQGLPEGGHPAVPPSADICSLLELFIPRSLRQQYSEWERESLDGIFVAVATKTSNAAESACGLSRRREIHAKR